MFYGKYAVDRDRWAQALYEVDRRPYDPSWESLSVVLRDRYLASVPVAIVPAAEFDPRDVRVLAERERDHVRRFGYGAPM